MSEFSGPVVEQILDECLRLYFGSMRNYEADKCAIVCQRACATIRSRLRAICHDDVRCRLVTQLYVVQESRDCVSVFGKSLLEHSTDFVITSTFRNKAVCAIAVAYAVYQ